MERTALIDREPCKNLIKIIAICLGIFQFAVALQGFLLPNTRCAVHLTFTLVLVSLMKPVHFKNSILTDVYNLLFTLVAVSAGAFVVYETRAAYALTYVINGPSEADIIAATIVIALILICVRRVTGWALPILASLFIAYALWGGNLPGLLSHKGYSWKTIVDVLMYSGEGIFGQPMDVASSYVAMFIIFGAFLSVSGAGQWFIDIAYALTGTTKSGPAMTAVVSSAAMGTISGTGVANVVTTGSFTIPLMISCGYSPLFAGAVEATASTGGQIMPPVMGAGAFILAEMLGTSYSSVALAALLPAVLFFLACGLQVHFEAGRIGLKGLPRNQLPELGPTFRRGLVYLIPISILIWALCIRQYSANYSAVYAIVSLVIVATLLKKKGERMNLKTFFASLETAGKDMPTVAMACATAGIMIGVLLRTGLTLKFTSLLIQLAGDSTFLLLVLTMICCIFLGMGLPTTAAFIITATLCAPALIEMGIPAMCAYMFVFYYASLSAITPPVALAAYAAAGISKASPMKTGFVATRLGISGFLIPFFFCYNPSLLLQGEVIEIVRAAITSVMGITCLAAGLEGYIFTNLRSYERIALIIVSGCLVAASIQTDIIGIALALIVFVPLMMRHRKEKQC